MKSSLFKALLAASSAQSLLASAEAVGSPVVLVFESDEFVKDLNRQLSWLLPQGIMEVQQCNSTTCSIPEPAERVMAAVGRVPAEILSKLPALKLLQSHSYMYPKLETIPSTITVAKYDIDWRSSGGMQNIAEFVIASTFEWQYRLRDRMRAFVDCAWAADAPKECSSASDLTRHETLMQKTMGVLGLGQIGTEVAKRAIGLGMRTVATKHSAPFTSDLPLAWIGDDNDKLLAESDFVVVTVPGTVKDIINATSLSLMKPGAVLIPVSASPVDFEALRSAIIAKRVGAVLDVWDEGCWHYPDYTCGAPYGKPSFPHHEHMERGDGEGALVLPGMAMRDGSYWRGSAEFAADNLGALFTQSPLKGVVRNGTDSFTV